ncbi:transmembrane protein, putative (macronuclear) [Tetrahymena thermophila SB210]|uniref:Transmembrane protein, putative n=1 Tax=Tetrahymena thermophila (strain SB210) TaxID=312017 RepID=W7XIX5_TETTS|nr:transmembrane protein, putative [Tetrahymena thermophila SB210]EWS73679.1 transmembrane protein, putative [Tetrahymena thermophila SB210]|eukprot:XP_012653809.1 transmembrane protein, putative [Tetrahymena thermophila SB210]
MYNLKYLEMNQLRFRCISMFLPALTLDLILWLNSLKNSLTGGYLFTMDQHCYLQLLLQVKNNLGVRISTFQDMPPSAMSL